MTLKRGVYFLANDVVLDQAIAFLNSFRTYNPSISLCLIPFADDIEQLRRLAPRYDFSIWSDLTILQQCDDISRVFHGRTIGQYRKLAAWEGRYDEFVYIDTDTVVLEDVDFAFEHLSQFDFVTSHSNDPYIRKWVWKDSIYGAKALTPEQISFAANTGFITSRRGCLTVDKVLDRLPKAVELAEHMELICVEQPLLNYLMVTSGMRYSSLGEISRHTGRLDIPYERWGGEPALVVQGGRVLWPDVPPTLLVHWAGEWQRAREENQPIPHLGLWEFYRNMQEAYSRD
jgi:hypothetical protein